jgi:hypothetical protein
MKIVWSGRLVGTFHGYKPGRTYELSDGSKRMQEDLTDEAVYRADPPARLPSNASVGSIYLDVEGTSAMVRVYRTGAGRSRPSGLSELRFHNDATAARRPAVRRFGTRRGWSPVKNEVSKSVKEEDLRASSELRRRSNELGDLCSAQPVLVLVAPRGFDQRKPPILDDEPARHVFAVNLQPPQRQTVRGTTDLDGNPTRHAVVGRLKNLDRERDLARTDAAHSRFVGVVGFHAG